MFLYKFPKQKNDNKFLRLEEYMSRQIDIWENFVPADEILFRFVKAYNLLAKAKIDFDLGQDRYFLFDVPDLNPVFSAAFYFEKTEEPESMAYLVMPYKIESFGKVLAHDSDC